MESTDRATLINLALKNGDPYSAAAVYILANEADKKKLELNMFDKRRDALLLARWEHTPSSVLETLANQTDNAIVVRLDKNPNTPTQALSRLYVNQSDVHKSMTVLIAQHPHTSLTVLKKIAQFEHDVASLLAVSKHAKADTDVLNILLNRFAAHPMLEMLQKSIAENPATSTELLEQLYQSEDTYVRAAVVGHANSSEYLISQALGENNIQILRKVASDHRLSEDVIVRLCSDQDKLVRSAIASNQSTPRHVVVRLAQDESEVVRRAIASRQDLPLSTVLHLMNDEDHWVRQKIARNPVAPRKVLNQLAKDEQADVRRGVARNSRCPAEVLRLLAVDENSWVRAAVAYQHKSPKALIVGLAEDKDIDILSGVASHPKTPQKLLRRFVNSTESDIRRSVILNGSATRLTLLPLLEDAYYLHRLMLMTNPRLKDQDKRHLCLDPDLRVRYTAFSYFANQFENSD